MHMQMLLYCIIQKKMSHSTFSPILNAFHHQVPTREFRTGGAKQSDAYTLEEDRDDPDKSLELFFEEYPVLQLVGTPKRIHSNM